MRRRRPELVQFQAQLKPIAGAIAAVGQLPGTYDDLMPQLQRRRMNLYARAPQFPESAYAVTEGKPAQAQIQLHGDPANLGSEVPRGTLQVLGGGALPATGAQGSGRLALANWIASKDNPTTARVIVNRLWQGHFGRGIVPTPNNFGTRGVPPSNQALLDFLASELVEKGWSLKAMQREILLSHTYRLSSENIAANEEIDPDAVYLWRHNASRLDAEEIRDTLLADSGLLDRTAAKPHPFPPQSEWNWEEQNPFTPDAGKVRERPSHGVHDGAAQCEAPVHDAVRWSGPEREHRPTHQQPDAAAGAVLHELGFSEALRGSLCRGHGSGKEAGCGSIEAGVPGDLQPGTGGSGAATLRGVFEQAQRGVCGAG